MDNKEFEVYSNIFEIDDTSVQAETITKSIFNIEVKGNSETEKELLGYLKKAHFSLNLAETVFQNPAVYIEAVKEYYGKNYRDSALYFANFTVMVESPVKCPVTVLGNSVLEGYDKIADVIENVIADYEKENYHHLPKKYIKVKTINIEFADDYETSTNNIIFKPQPDGLIQKITVSDIVDNTVYDTITPAEMEAEIQAALQANANTTVDEASPCPVISYAKWEAKNNKSMER